VAQWVKGLVTVRFLLDRGRLESLEAVDLSRAADTLIERAALRLDVTAKAALRLGDVDGAYSAAYDAYRLAAESLLVRQGLRATGGDGSHMAVEDAVSAQFSDDIPAFAKPTFEQLRRTRHSVQYLDLTAPPVTPSDAEWAIGKADEADTGARTLLSGEVVERFATEPLA
jgi:HEPN domain